MKLLYQTSLSIISVHHGGEPGSRTQLHGFRVHEITSDQLSMIIFTSDCSILLLCAILILLFIAHIVPLLPYPFLFNTYKLLCTPLTATLCRLKKTILTLYWFDKELCAGNTNIYLESRSFHPVCCAISLLISNLAGS